MWLAAKTFWTAKEGNLETEYEDAFWPHDDTNSDHRLFRYAVADGATQTSFSKLWAQLLVRAYCKVPPVPARLHKWLNPLQGKWQSEVNTKPLPWFAQEKVRQGAFATLVGLTLAPARDDEGGEGQWTAVAIGDSCLFHIREKQVLKAFPLVESSEFNNSPALLSSNPVSNEGLEALLYLADGSWRPGDLFLLMTDALACWFLRSFEEQTDPILQLGNINSQDEFLEFARKQRLRTDESGRKVMRNDDLTLTRILVS